jgi:hypothetical protein
MQMQRALRVALVSSVSVSGTTLALVSLAVIGLTGIWYDVRCKLKLSYHNISVSSHYHYQNTRSRFVGVGNL